MYILPPGIKRDPQRRWNLPDRVFFACGACHILAFALMERYPQAGFRAMWIKPAEGFTGNHIVALRGDPEDWRIPAGGGPAPQVSDVKSETRSRRHPAGPHRVAPAHCRRDPHGATGRASRIRGPIPAAIPPCGEPEATGALSFDYHGWSRWPRLMAHMRAKANRWWPGWDCTLRELPAEVLVSEAKSLQYDGLHLREPRQFLHDALPRARRFLDRFPPPPEG